MEYPKDYLENIKRVIESKHKEHFELNKQLYDTVTSAIEQINARELSSTTVSLYETIVLSVLAKNRKHFKGVQELCKIGFGEEASLIVRSMANALIDLTYITNNDREKLSARFARFSWVAKEQKIKSIKILDDYKKLSFLDQLDREKLNGWEETKQEIYKEIAKFKEDYKIEDSKNDWSGCSIRTKAERSNKEMEMLYHGVYKSNSDIEHSNAIALNKYIKHDISGEIEFLCEPSEDCIEENLRDSHIIFLGIVFIFFEQFKLTDFNKKTLAINEAFLKLHHVDRG